MHKWFQLLVLWLSPPLLLAASAEKEPPDLPSVVVRIAEKQENSDRFFYPVTIDSRQDSEVYAEINGVVKDIKVALGASVQSNDVLLLIQQTRPDFAYTAFAVRSPITGKVAGINKKIGSRVQQGDSLIQIVNSADLVFRIEIPESELTIFKAEMRGTMECRSFEEKLPVVIAGISPQVSPLTGTASAELAFASKDISPAILSEIRKKLFPGMIGRAMFVTNTRQTFRLPKEALSLEQKTYFLRIVRDGVIVRKNLVLGKEFGNEVEILSGIDPGDAVVVSRQRFLKEGERVQVESPTP